jgi:Flp pilus assembly protein CpaB
VYAGFDVIPVRADGVPQSGGQSRPVLRLIVPNVEVVRLGSSGGVASSSRTNTVSLRLSDDEAAKVAWSSDNGKVWLALRPAAGAKAARPNIVTAETLLLGVRPITVIHSLGGRR